MKATNTKTFDAATTEWKLESYVVELEEDEDGGVVATIPTLRGCISQGNTREEALNRLAEALSGWLEVAEKRGLEIPPPPQRI